MSKEINIEEAISELKHISNMDNETGFAYGKKNTIRLQQAIETVLKELKNKDLYINMATEIIENSISKDKIRDRQMQREFELQQEYKDFEDDVEWNVYQKLLKGSE